MNKWIKIFLTLLIVAVISIGAYFILRACGVTSIDGLRSLVARCGAIGWIVFIILFIICTSLLCFIPGTSATFIAVSILCFGAMNGFLISTIAVFLGSSLMFLIGNTLGEKTAAKIVGPDELKKAQDLIDVKSKIFLPLMFVFPVFPDDALCLAAGMTKMKYLYFAIVALIFRTIGIATICFLGSGLIDWAILNWAEWVCLINLCIFDIVLVFIISNRIEKHIKSKRVKSDKQDINE